MNARLAQRLVAVCLATLLAVAVGALNLEAQEQKDKDKAKPKDVATTKDKAKSKEAAVYTFEVYKDRADNFRWRLKSDDGQLAMASTGYATKEECLKVIDTIKKEAAKAKVEDQTKGK